MEPFGTKMNRTQLGHRVQLDTIIGIIPAEFLGVGIEIDQATGLMEMKQTGLIDWVIETLGLDLGKTSGKFTQG